MNCNFNICNQKSGLEKNSKKRLLIFHPYLAPYRIDIFNSLNILFDLKIIFQFSNLPEQKFNQKNLKKKLNCQYDYLLSGLNLGTRQVRLGVSKKIKAFRPDAIVCHEYGPTSLICALLRRFNHEKWGLVSWTSDNVIMCETAKFYRRVPRRMVLSSADSMVVYSNEVKKWYAQYGFESERIFVSPNIQNEENFSSEISHIIEKSLEYQNSHNLTGKKIVLFVGRLAEEKGIDRIIKSFLKVITSDYRAVLVIVGDGPEKSSLVKLVNSLNLNDHVIFAGRFEGNSLKAWYHIANTFILASHFEPYGAVVNEALLSGLKVLCSKVAGARGLICDGINGFTFDPYDNSAISDLIIRELHDSAPLSVDRLLQARQPLMPVLFEEAVNEYAASVRTAFRW